MTPPSNQPVRPLDAGAQRERKIAYILLVGLILLVLIIWLERKSGLSWEDVTGSVAALMIILVTDVLRWMLGHDGAKEKNQARRADRLWVIALIEVLVTGILTVKNRCVGFLKRFEPTDQTDAASGPVVAGFDPQKVLKRSGDSAASAPARADIPAGDIPAGEAAAAEPVTQHIDTPPASEPEATPTSVTGLPDGGGAEQEFSGWVRNGIIWTRRDSR